jgi:signal transduction histidine kinase
MDKVFKILKDQDSISLGLTLCKEIVKKFNGSLTFESVYKKGSTFSFCMDLENA